MCSWYVSGEFGAVFSNLINVSPGQVVLGSTSKPVGSSTTNWSIVGVNLGTGQNTTLAYTTHRSTFVVAFVVLEQYWLGQQDCTLYPPTGQLFFNLTARTWSGAPITRMAWQPMTINNGCNEHAVVGSGPLANVTIVFK